MVVLGLTAAFIVFLTVAIQCRYDFGYNRNFKDADKIYLIKVKAAWMSSGWALGSNIPVLREMKQTYPEIIDYCGIFPWSIYPVSCFITREDGTTAEFADNCKFGATETFPSFFNLKIITGNVQQFSEPGKAIITASYAKKIFGKTNPVGQVMKLKLPEERGEAKLFTVVAVCEDFPENCSLGNGIYYSVGPDRDTVNGLYDTESFVKVNPQTSAGDIAALNRKIIMSRYETEHTYRAFPLKTFHFSEAGTGNIVTTLSLLFVGIIALAIAWTNFINFSIAMAPSRVKSLNIQKIFGANTGLLRLVIASESAIFTLIAFLPAVAVTGMIHKFPISEFFSASMMLSANWQVVLFTGIFIILLGFILGMYPAYYATSFKPAATLSGLPLKTNKAASLKNILTVVQFATAIAVIIIVVIVKQQYHYAVNYSYGYEQKSIISVSAGRLNPANRKVFAEELKTNPRILDWTSTNFVPGLPGISVRHEKFEDRDRDIMYSVWSVQENFMRFFNIPVIEGDDFMDTPVKSAEQIIVNEKLAKEMGADIIGKKFDGHDIIGIAKNINYESLHRDIAPFGFIKERNNISSSVYLKISGREVKKTIAYIKSVWEKFSSEPFEVNFLDAQLARRYEKENNFANFLTVISIITIIIAIMGIYGMIALNIRKKEKEIALRKICGASLRDILLLLNRGALIQLVIAFAVAAPAAYYVTSRWLETFAYKISIRWWVFVLCWLFMCVIILATICMQTYRAAMKNPVDAIKTE
jgi:putative ABC transport system permease protein